MKTLAIRDLRLHWPVAEKALETEDEIVVTRDGKPVAKLVRFPKMAPAHPRFDPKEHLAKLRKILNRKGRQTVDEQLGESRGDRFLK